MPQLPLFIRQLTSKVQVRHRTEIAWVMASQSASLIGGLLLLKLLTNLLPAATFGYVSLITIAIIFPSWLFFLPFSQALIRFYSAHKVRSDLPRLIGTTLRGYILSSLVVICLGLLAALFGLQHVAGISIVDLGLSVALLIIEVWRGLASGILAADRNRTAIAKQSAVEAVLRPALTYGFISMLGPVVWTVLTAYICSSLILLYWVYASLGEMIPKTGVRGYDGQLAREMLRYGFPMGIAAVFSWIQGYADRFVVAFLLGIDVAGQYAAAIQLCQFPFVAGASFLSVLIGPVANQIAGDASSEKATAKSIRLISTTTAAFAALGLLLIPVYYFFGELLMTIVASKEYVMPAALVTMLVVGALLRSIGNLLSQSLLVKNRTDRFLALFSLLGTVSPVIFYLLISRYQLFGAGLAFVCVGGLYALSFGLIVRGAERVPLSILEAQRASHGEHLMNNRG